MIVLHEKKLNEEPQRAVHSITELIDAFDADPFKIEYVNIHPNTAGSSATIQGPLTILNGKNGSIRSNDTLWIESRSGKIWIPQSDFRLAYIRAIQIEVVTKTGMRFLISG